MTWLRCDVSPQAGRRWCLSGTPIQNSVDDLYSCFRFLRYNPYCKRAAFKTMLKDPLQDDPAKGAQLLQVCLKVSDIGLSAQAFCILHCQSWSWQSIVRIAMCVGSQSANGKAAMRSS